MQWQFSITSSLETVKTVGQRVFKKGKIFQCGDYPDKGVTVKQDELAAANKAFDPVALNIEHWHSVLDGRLGELIAVEFSDDGAVYGLLSIPKALDELMQGEKELPVSIEIEHGTMKIVGLAFAKFPRVPDAAVFAAFGVQPPQQRKEKKMNLKELLKSAFSKAVDDLPDDQLPEVKPTPAPTQTPTQAVTDPTLEAQVKAEKEAREKAEKELADLKETNAKADETREQELVLAASKSFAEGYVKERKILPSQVEAVALQYGTALKADNAGKACFAEGKAVEGAATKALRGMLDAQPVHKWSQDFMGNAQLKTVSGDNGKTNMSDDRRAELMGKSSLGRAAVKTAKGAK